MNPLFYYNPMFFDKKELDNRIKEIKKGEEIPDENIAFYDLIEKKIKTKYNMLIPAIFMEFKSSSLIVEFNKEDLKKVFY